MLQKQLRSQKKIPSPWYGKMFIDIISLPKTAWNITYTVNYMHCSKINSGVPLVQIVNFFYLQKNT